MSTTVKPEKERPKTLSIEEALPLFIDDELMQLMPDIRLFRVDSRGYRYYYKIGHNQAPIFYLSMTSFCNSVLPPSKPLDDWRIRLGKDESEEAARVAAAYGTFMHTRIAAYLIEGYYDHNESPALLSDFMAFEGIPGRFFSPWMDDIENDMLSFAQFCIDKEVTPLGVEFPVCGLDGLAGMIDLPCRLTHRKRRVNAIVDYKSGRKGFWDSHELQLVGYKRVWNSLFKGTPYEMDMIFNWAPCDWRETPTYKLQDQTKSVMEKKFDSYHEIFKINGNRNPDKTFKRMTQPLTFGSPIENCYEVLSLTDYVTEKIQRDARQIG